MYFPDGDIVISATSNWNGRVHLLRVDKVFLMRHSQIFKDMFVVGESNPQVERYDGVPRVHLPDPAEDVVTLIEALYDITWVKTSTYS